MLTETGLGSSLVGPIEVTQLPPISVLYTAANVLKIRNCDASVANVVKSIVASQPEQVPPVGVSNGRIAAFEELKPLNMYQSRPFPNLFLLSRL